MDSLNTDFQSKEVTTGENNVVRALSNSIIGAWISAINSDNRNLNHPYNI